MGLLMMTGWERIRDELFRVRQDAPRSARSWQPSEKATLDLLALAEELKGAEAPHRTEIEWAIDVWLRSRCLPAVSAGAATFFGLRLDEALSLAQALALHESGIPVPLEGPGEKAVLRWLLMDYWDRRGRLEAARSWVVDGLTNPE